MWWEANRPTASAHQRYEGRDVRVCILLLILLVCAVQIFDLAARKADKRNR